MGRPQVRRTRPHAPGEAQPRSSYPEHVFACLRCGNCCRGLGGIALSPEDIRRLRAYLRIDEASLLRLYTESGAGQPVLRGRAGDCVFLRGSSCSIYPARPDICRAWPFFRGNLIDQVSFAMARQDCPGISSRIRHPDFAWAGFDYLDKHHLLAGEKNMTGRVLLVKKEELPVRGEVK